MTEWGELLANRRECREFDKRSAVGPREPQPDAGADLEAVRSGIGSALRTIHSGVLREEFPDAIAALLKLLDHPKADTA